MIVALLVAFAPDSLWWMLAIGIIIQMTVDPCGTCCEPSGFCPSSDQDLEAVYGELTICTECVPYHSDFAQVTGYTGLGGGPVTLTWDTDPVGFGPGWAATIGTITLTTYFEFCFDPTGEVQTGDVVLVVTCEEGAEGAVLHARVYVVDFPMPFESQIFSGDGTFDEEIDNTITCDGAYAAFLSGPIVVSLAA